MAKSSRYMQGLLGVIASGRRRKPVYIRQSTLVSKLYPYYYTEKASASVAISDVAVLALGSAAEFSDKAQSAVTIETLTIFSPIKVSTTVEGLNSAVTINDFSVMDVTQIAQFSDNADASITIESLSIETVAIVTNVVPEVANAQITISDFYLGGI